MPTADHSAREPVAPVLEARGVSRRFRSGSALRPRWISAVDDVTLALEPGRVLAVVGESGCGKSTLARILVGLETPDAGSVAFRGEPALGPDRRHTRGGRRLIRSGVQMIFQDPFTSLDPRMSVERLVTEPLAATGMLRTRHERRERAADLLAVVGLSAEMLSRFPHQFSGGQRQRIGIARALAADPQVLVCDEPVSALDVSVQAQVINLFGEIRERLGIAVLFISHDLSVVRHIADEVAVMYLGRIAEHGPAEEIFTRPRHPYTQALLSATPSVAASERGRLARRRVLRGEPPSPIDPPSGCRFHPRCWLASEQCGEQQPPLLEVGPGRVTACYHHDRIGDAAGTDER